jgi:hypothetical protein
MNCLNNALISREQKVQLSNMIDRAFIEIRSIAFSDSAEQVSALSDIFHNLAGILFDRHIWYPECFRQNLVDYHSRYPHVFMNYLKEFDSILPDVKDM